MTSGWLPKAFPLIMPTIVYIFIQFLSFLLAWHVYVYAALGLKMGKYFDCAAFCMWKTNASNCTHACQPNQSRATMH